MAKKLTRDQQRIVDTLDRPLFVAAGAGSGKSSTLAERVCQAFLPGPDGEPPFLTSLDQVLVITFTHASADDIKEKIRARLREAGLVEQALQVDTAWISTIHGMCARILHRHAFDLGIDPEFSLVDETDASAMTEDAINEVLREIQREGRYPALREAFDLRGRNGDDDAGTIMGMVGRLRAAAASAVEGFDSLSFPGTEPDIAGDLARLKNAYEALLATGRVERCFRSKSGQEAELALQAACERLGAIELLPAGQRAQAASEAFASLYKPNKKFGTAAYKAMVDDALACHQACALDLAFAGMGPAAEDLLAIAREVDGRYRQKKAERGVLDNDDLLSLTLSAFRDHPGIAAEYSDKFKLVMVDEFQDTNAQQVRMIELLSGPDACHLATVGDAQQSIYRFRAADVEVFRSRERALSGSASDSYVRLTKNFRSHGDILAFVEKLLGHGLLDEFMPLEPCVPHFGTYEAEGLPRADFELVSAPRGSRGVKAPSSETRVRALAEMIADRIAEQIASGESPDDCVLLLGRMKNVGIYLDALRARGINCVVSGGSTFSDAEEVRLVAALLHFLASPKDTDAGLFPLLESDMFQLDADDYCVLATKQQENVDAYAKRTIDRGLLGFDLVPGAKPSKRLLRARDVLGRALSRVGSWQIGDILLGVMRESGWLARLEAEGAEGLAQAANALAAARFASELADSHGIGVARCAQEFDLWLEVSKQGPASLSGGAAGAVRVMTIHASKGLEFPVVAVSECWSSDPVGGITGVTCENDGGQVLGCLIPKGVSRADLKAVAPDEDAHPVTRVDWAAHIIAHEDAGEAAESARLLYVAITRAKEAVILGMETATTKKSRGTWLAEGVLDALFDTGLPPVGESAAEYGGSAPCRVRHMAISAGEGADGAWLYDAGGAFQMPERQDASAGSASFPLFYPEVEQGLAWGLGATRPWPAQEGVFSFTSAHEQMRARRLASGTVPADADGAASATPAPGRLRRLPETVEAGSADDAGVEPATDDQDRATNLGSAFHELAQALAESGREPSAGHVAAMERYWHLSKRACGRLERALSRWESSKLRAEALSYGLVRSEVPFFMEADAPYGTHVEGAIDLLATNPGDGHALVVDYKTGDAGLALDEIAARHEMQANFYASVLMRQGFDSVDCAFACVERDAAELGGEAGQPVVVRYRFDAAHQPVM